MSMPEMSEVVTEQVRIGATAFFLPDESKPDEARWVFGYRIVIVNEGPTTIKLLSRHWLIIDGDGKREEVRGPGVVGETPELDPGKGFKYTSYCPLETPWGTMEGEYEMERADGSRFTARVGRFYLAMARREQAEL